MPFRPIRRLRLGLKRPGLRGKPSLQTANSLLASGHPGEAANLFAELAQQMEAKGQAIRAANLHARAAHAYADSNAEKESLTEARLALTQFMALNLAERIPVFYRNITRKFRKRGMRQALQTLEAECGMQIELHSAPAEQPTELRSALPAECPHCGAPVLSTDVEWIDSQRARCEYCGGVLQAPAEL